MSADTHTHRFDQAWRQERDRLRALEALFDPATTRHLAGLGPRDGWRCLEVGAGAGSIARWLAMRVGPSGHVLATDLDPRFPDDHGHDNLEVSAQPWVRHLPFVAVTAWGRRPFAGGAG